MFTYFSVIAVTRMHWYGNDLCQLLTCSWLQLSLIYLCLLFVIVGIYMLIEHPFALRLIQNEEGLRGFYSVYFYSFYSLSRSHALFLFLFGSFNQITSRAAST